MSQQERSLITRFNPKSPIAEAYRTLRTNLHFAIPEGELKTLMVTSAGPGEGKSTTIANLAITLAQAGKKVLLLDCDLRKPRQHKIFGLANDQGVSNILVEKLDWRTARKEIELSLDLISSGPIPPNPSELLGSIRFTELLQELGQEYDLVLIDAPPAIAVTDAVIIAGKVDGTILVVRSGVARSNMLKKAVEQIEKAQGKILGTVMNGMAIKTEDYHYYYYYGQEKKGKGKSKIALF